MSSAAAKGNGMLTNRRVARPLERITCTFISYSACIISRLLHRLAIPFDMSLPDFSTQAELFSTAGLSGTLFAEKDRYRLFARKVYLALARARIQLEKCDCPEKGRVAIEPVLLLGVSILQYLEGAPDRQAIVFLRYHAGWNFALNRQVGDPLFHPTTLVNFRQRLLEHDLSTIGFETVLQALQEAGLVVCLFWFFLDTKQMIGRVIRKSQLDNE